MRTRGDSGRFHIIVVPGNYTLRVAAPGYLDATIPVTVGASWIPQAVQLTPTGSQPIVAEDFEDAATATGWTLDPADTALFHCAVCQRIRCYDCKTADMNANPPTREVMALIGASAGASAGGDAVTSDQMDAAIQSIRRDTPDKWVACSECNASFCYGCLDDVSARSLMTSWASNGQDFGAAALSSLLTQVPGRIKGTNRFQCSACYWKSKPCTNPTCPNEIGVQTKRCGGCHIDRYCSVECQAAAYPDHVEKCNRIQDKRAADEKKAG